MERNKIPAAVHLLLIKDEKILLLRRFNTGYEDGNYSVCAGHIDENEVYYEAMKREAKEEIGIDINDNQLKPVQVMHRKSTEERVDYFFAAGEWQGEIKNMEPDKCDELRWVDLSDLPSNTISYVRYAIKQYLNDKPFTDFGW